MTEIDGKASTHVAYALRRGGRHSGQWLEIGTARAEGEGVIRVLLDRLPTGGFAGSVLLSPIGKVPSQRPHRPGAVALDDEFDAG